MMNTSTSSPARKPPAEIGVALVGVHGYGLHHLRALEPLRRDRACRLVAVADPQSPQPESARLIADAPHYPSLDELLEAHRPDVVILATPLPTHHALATTALRAGCHVLLEKPPTVTMAEFEDLLATAKEVGRTCQVGFQSLGSSAYDEIERVISAGEVGEVTGIGAIGTWIRPTQYYARAPWAGLRTFNGQPVVDGVVTNPLAHAIATALRIEGSMRAEQITGIELDLYHAHDIEADDTSSVVISTARGTTIAAGLTLCASEQTQPRIVVHGTQGSVTYYYKLDVVEVVGTNGPRRIECSTVTLLENLMAHTADPSVALLSSLENAGGFMRVLEAVRTAEDPRPIPDEFVEWRDDSQGRHPVVADVERWCERVAFELRTFSDLGAPWTG